MNFHLGKPILVMVGVALVTGALVLFRRPPPKKDLVVWVFADSHFTAYQPLIPGFERQSGRTVDLQLVSNRAMQVRLQGIFSSDRPVRDAPDLVEIEISSIGKFFRPPLDKVGFVPLAPLLKRDTLAGVILNARLAPWSDRRRVLGLLRLNALLRCMGNSLYDEIVPSRYAPWSKEGAVFGVPHDLHPCTITYRDDLFREAGIDLATMTTWPAFHDACVNFQNYWRSRGYPTRHAIEMSASNSDQLYTLLLQRHVNPVDQYNHIHLNDPKVANTIAFYARCVAGPRDIASYTSGGDGPLTKDINEGNLCAFITADWRVGYVKKFAPDLAGKMRMMPLPIFEPGDAPTSTWGGTMIALLKTSEHREDAWELAKHLYFSPEGLKERHEKTGILPPIKTLWAGPEYHRPDPYFGGQKADELFIALARQIPERHVTPATSIASLYLTQAMNRAVDYVKAHADVSDQQLLGRDLERECQRWLDDYAGELQKTMKQWEFDVNEK